MKWNGIEIAGAPYMPRTGIAIVDGQVWLGEGLAWICTLPPCLLEVDTESLVELPQELVDALVELLKAPPKPRGPWEWPFAPQAPRAEEFRVPYSFALGIREPEMASVIAPPLDRAEDAAESQTRGTEIP